MQGTGFSKVGEAGSLRELLPEVWSFEFVKVNIARELRGSHQGASPREPTSHMMALGKLAP